MDFTQRYLDLRREISQELSRSVYYDMESGNDRDSIDYDALINLLAEMCARIEKLEGSND